MTDQHPPREPTSSDELLETLQSANPPEAPDIAESLAEALAADLDATAPVAPDGEEENS